MLANTGSHSLLRRDVSFSALSLNDLASVFALMAAFKLVSNSLKSTLFALINAANGLRLAELGRNSVFL